MGDNLPVPKDPTTAAVEKGIEEAAATARHYMDKLLGAGLEQGGGLIADTVGFWRFKNKINLVLKAKAFLESKGIEPQVVLPKTAIPILEAGSLESDDDMQSRWAALLANAATPGIAILPGYAEVLRQLTAPQARMLDWLYLTLPEPSYSTGSGFFGSTEPEAEPSAEQDDLCTYFSIDESTYRVLASDMHRLQLIDGRRHVQVVDSRGIFDTGTDKGWSSSSNYEHISITPFGRAFVRACQSDSAASSP